MGYSNGTTEEICETGIVETNSIYVSIQVEARVYGFIQQLFQQNESTVHSHVP